VAFSSHLRLPFKLRFLVVKRPELLKRLELRLVRAVWRWQRAVARRLGVSGPFRGGAVVFTQWFVSSLQVTPHLHGLVAEALWTPTGELVELPAPDTAFRRGHSRTWPSRVLDGDVASERRERREAALDSTEEGPG
jgi:hypothetical protein